MVVSVITKTCVKEEVISSLFPRKATLCLQFEKPDGKSEPYIVFICTQQKLIMLPCSEALLKVFLRNGWLQNKIQHFQGGSFIFLY